MTDLLDRLKTALADRYIIERELGSGGMAVVYLARDQKLNRHVALKVLRPELAASLGTDRFLREIEIAAKLTHPNILSVHDCGEADGLLYYVMPYIEGESLRHRLKREKQLSIEDALQITREVAEALGHAHEQGIVHRDVKPENVMFEAGHAVVTDFGIARAITAAGGEQLTEAGLAVGTPAYMSPEQASGEKDLDARTDVYALGCVLYEMLGGEPPYTGPTAQAILAKKVSEPAPSLRVVRPTVPEPVESAVAQALAVTPADRQSTASQLVELLGREAVAAAPPRRRLRRAVGIAVGVAAVALVATGVVIGLIPGLRSSAETAGVDRNLFAVLPFQAVTMDSQVANLATNMPILFHAKLGGGEGPTATDPGMSMEVWSRAGGTVETPLPLDEAVQVARRLGAGWALTGTVAGTIERLRISAHAVEVPSRRVRGEGLELEGTYGDYLTLLDAFVPQLLGSALGRPHYELPALADHPLEAVRAYLAGLAAGDDEDEAHRHYARALSLDSTFALAALQKFQKGESDLDAARVAWDHQDQLTNRERLKLRALVGPLMGLVNSARQEIELWREAAPVTDEWYELGEALSYWGPEVGGENWRQELQQSLDTRNAQLERMGQPIPRLIPYRLLELAIGEDDTASTRRWAAELRRVAPDWASRLYLRWLIAMTLHDSVQAAEVFEEWLGNDTALAHVWIVAYAMHTGRGITFAESTLARRSRERLSGPRVWQEVSFWRSLGKYQAYRDRREADVGLSSPIGGALARIYLAVYMTGDLADSAATAAAEVLERVVGGDLRADARWHHVARAHCWLGQWHLARGEERGVRASIRYLLDSVPEPQGFVVCAAMLEALLAQAERGDLRSAVLRLDSMAKELPYFVAGERRVRVLDMDWTRYVRNLVASDLLLEIGDTTGALAAARRRVRWQMSPVAGGLHVDMLRREARLSALLGDTAAAIEAYNRYLAIRRDPDTPWREEWKQVRAELAELVGEPLGG
jgi:tRNA A-37 threonylcarbamoyl transferase component Bud32